MEGSLRDLSKYRFENGLESLEDARIMFNIGGNRNVRFNNTFFFKLSQKIYNI